MPNTVKDSGLSGQHDGERSPATTTLTDCTITPNSGSLGDSNYNNDYSNYNPEHTSGSRVDHKHDVPSGSFKIECKQEPMFHAPRAPLSPRYG